MQLIPAAIRRRTERRNAVYFTVTLWLDAAFRPVGHLKRAVHTDMHASVDAYRNFELERPPVPGRPSLAWRYRPSVGQRARRNNLAWSEGRIQGIGFEKGDQMRQCVNWAVQCVGADAVFDHLAIFAERDCNVW